MVRKLFISEKYAPGLVSFSIRSNHTYTDNIFQEALQLFLYLKIENELIIKGVKM